MAIRIHVTAVRDCPADEVGAAFASILGPSFSCVELNEQGGWVWFTTSVWGVGAGDLNRGLCQLARPALQFTTSDGDRWYLTVHGGELGQVHFLHEFCYHGHPASPDDDAERAAALETQAEPPPVDPRLAFLEDDPPEDDTRPKSPFDVVADELAGLGGGVPEEFRAAVAHLPYSQAVNQYREWHADRVTAALAAAGIPHDPAALRAVLLWENISEGEASSDLGNLPRLLSVLGLGGEWDAWVQQAEAPPTEAEAPPEPEGPPEPPAPPPDYFTPVLACADPLGITPVAGGPVPLPLKDMALVRFFPESCTASSTCGVVLSVALPPAFDRKGVAQPTDPEAAGQVELTPDGFRVGLPNHLWFGRRDLRNLLGKELAHLLFHLPDGAVLDCAFGEAAQPAMNQRYRGPIAGGAWQIDATHPPLTREALADALALAASADNSKHRARDEAEAEAIVQAARRDPNLSDMTIVRKGRVVRCEADIVGHLARLFFRHRFRAQWDVGPAERDAAAEYQRQQDLKRQMRRAGAAAARRRAAPHDAEVLLVGVNGRYWRSDFTQLTELEQETRAKFDATMRALGFVHVGDLVAKSQRDIVLRTYVAPDGLSYGVLMGKRTMYLGYEFFTRLADGSMLTTTTNWSVESDPETGFFAKKCADVEPEALYEKHRWAIGRFRTRQGTEPVPLGRVLPEVAREFDGAFARRAAATS